MSDHSVTLVILLLSASLSLLPRSDGVEIFVAPTPDPSQAGSSNDSLQTHLCTPGQLVSNTTLLLGRGTHHVQEGPSCLIADITDLTITSGEETPARIICSFSSAGRNFVFLNITNLTLQGVVVENCGSVLPQDLPPFVNDTFTYIQTRQRCVFLFSHVYHLQLTDLTTVGSFGFSILAVNIRGYTELDGVNLTRTDNYRHSSCFGNETDLSCSGSGAMFVYSDRNDTTFDSSTSITISRSSFTYNEHRFHIFNFLPVFISIRSSFVSDRLLLTGASGLGFHFGQISYNVDVRIVSTEISHNVGFGSSLIFLLHNTLRNVQIEMDGCVLEDNEGILLSRGGAMVVLVVEYIAELSMFPPYPPNTHELLTIHNTSFIDNVAEIGGAAYFYLTPQNLSDYQITFDNVTFSGNMAAVGSVFEASTRQATFTQNSVTFLLQDVIAINNTFPGNLLNSATNIENSAAFVFLRIFNTTISGRHDTEGSLFQSNTPGAFLFLGGQLYVSGKIEFTENVALRGGALSLYDYALLFIFEGSRIKFNRNSATQVGGAIYANSLGTGTASTCVFQVIGPSRISDVNQVSDLDLRLRFNNNTALEGGNSIYANPLYNCAYLPESSLVDVTIFYDSSILYNSVFDFQSNVSNGLTEIASIPERICFCSGEEELSTPSTLCMDTSRSISVFPGQRFTIYAFPVDLNFNPVSSVMFVNVADSETHRLGDAQNTRQLNGSKCTVIDFNLFGPEHTETSLTLYTHLNGIQIVLDVYLEGCPHGFVSTPHPNGGITCSCDPYITEVLRSSCNTTTYTIERRPNTWLGVYQRDDNHSDVIFVQSCPIGLCTLTLTSTFIDLSQEDSLCLNGRTGILCGACEGNLSVVFGSPNCRECSNYWLLTIFFYAIIGLLLVACLFILNIKVSHGTVNGLGIIFYVNIISVNANILFQANNRGFLFIWVSLLNLELGFPLCFYDGMNEVAKAGLQCVFPIYLLLICFFIIILSRRSSRIAKLTSSQALQVLATLIYLCFSKMLRYVIDILTFATLNSKAGDRVIWLFDGTIEYFTGSHIIIVIFPAIVTSFFIILFTTAMIFIRQIDKYSSRFKPLMDAYGGPFKDKYRFWFGLRLLVLMIMCITYASLGTDYAVQAILLQQVFLVFFMVLQAFIRPFRKPLINGIDIFLMFNLFSVFIYTLRIFISSSTDDNALRTQAQVINFLIGLAFILFVLLISFHAVSLFYKIPAVEAKFKPLIAKFRNVSFDNFFSDCSMIFRKPVEMEEDAVATSKSIKLTSINGTRYSSASANTTSSSGGRGGVTQTFISLEACVSVDDKTTNIFTELREPIIEDC